MQQVTQPYYLISTDHNFYLKTVGQVFPHKQYLRINRLTSKCDMLSQSKFKQQTNQISAKFGQKLHLILGIITILQQPYLCVVNSCHPVATYMQDKVYQIKSLKYIPFKHNFLYTSTDQSDTQKILQKINNQIINDNFYFCYIQDITLNYDKKILNNKVISNKKYFWNLDLLQIFYRHSLSACWIVPVMQGFVRQIHCQNGNVSFSYVNISRRSKYMSGTRFNSRGIDHQCNVANFVQTQQIVICNNLLFSHISIRGSVPIFWEQDGIRAPIQFHQQQQQNQLIIKKHYQYLQNQYTAQIVTCNLLSKTKSPQKQLNKQFQLYFNNVIKGPYLDYDLNHQIKGQIYAHREVQNFVKSKLDLLVGKTNFLCIQLPSNKIISRQNNIPRINCLDCLDRTNVVMARISELYLEQVCKFINANIKSSLEQFIFPKSFNPALLALWAQLGNKISVIYSGTDSVSTYLTKKQHQTIFKYLSSSLKSINRYYNASINDITKQQCLDYLLAKKNYQIFDYFQHHIIQHQIQQKLYCTYQEFGIYITTWNCNMIDPSSIGNKNADKIFNFNRDDVDIVIVCLQQIVQLTSLNVFLGNNQLKIESWKKFLWQYINSQQQHIPEIKSHKQKRYQFLTCHDLVGISTFVFVSTKVIEHINNIQWFEIKTGFKGSLGNKGVIILFINIYSSIITIMNCHLAAGQTKSNERIQDIQYIHRQAIKQRKYRRLFDNCDFRFFIGDFNFRLEMKSQKVLQSLYQIQQKNREQRLSKNQLIQILRNLLQKDEFNINRNLGSLSSYNQQQISFLPTYKYIKNEKQYDKKRIPSWCDRILVYTKKKHTFKSINYFDSNIHLSDHKPVCGIFKIICKKQNNNQKLTLINNYYQI